MARTQKNKATAHHLGLLKAKLAKLKRELLDPVKGSGGGGAGEGIAFFLIIYYNIINSLMAPIMKHSHIYKCGY
jgi:hypothetical protein